MGNRAIINIKGFTQASIYIQWNGGASKVLGFVEEAHKRFRNTNDNYKNEFMFFNQLYSTLSDFFSSITCFSDSEEYDKFREEGQMTFDKYNKCEPPSYSTPVTYIDVSARYSLYIMDYVCDEKMVSDNGIYTVELTDDSYTLTNSYEGSLTDSERFTELVNSDDYQNVLKFYKLKRVYLQRMYQEQYS